MDAVTIPIVVGADRRLVVDLPPSTPLGPAELVIRPRAGGLDRPVNEAREMRRTKLLAAGFLITEEHAPAEAAPLSDAELAHLGELAPGARASEVLIDEDRGSY